MWGLQPRGGDDYRSRPTIHITSTTRTMITRARSMLIRYQRSGPASRSHHAACKYRDTLRSG
jgi:hypothetical protein